ncbi:MAG: hypothetical protein HY520_02445 [Candidatus Aenigmarchaeota archaeon]|nr:hypothetical protein [Candidatus Aenigmarchaeota archaeon]
METAKLPEVPMDAPVGRMVELERTFLAKALPPGLARCRSIGIVDLYVPREGHPVLRLRKRGDRYEITKKAPLRQEDCSRQEELTIPLSPPEFAALAASPGRRLEKIRYFYSWQGKTLEVDVFQGPLAGLVLVDAEFSTTAARDAFAMPPFCLAEVTQETAFAGGMLCGKRYADLHAPLARHGYRPLSI